MSTASPEVDDLRRRMAEIRRSLHADVQGVVEGAEAATDWRRYVRNYPLATLGAALAVGYLIVPRRRKETTIVAALPEAPPVLQSLAAAPAKPEKKGKGLLGTAFGLVAPVALRAAQGYALQFFEQWMAQRMADQLQNHPDLASAFGAPPASSPGPQARPPGAPRF